MPLKIGILSQAYHPAVGGVTEHVDQSAHALVARGHQVSVITARFSERAYGPSLPNGYPVFRIGRNLAVPYNGAENNLTVGLGLQRKLEALLARERFDLLHVHCPVSPFLPLLALKIAKQPVGRFIPRSRPTWRSVSSGAPCFPPIEGWIARSRSPRRRAPACCAIFRGRWTCCPTG